MYLVKLLTVNSDISEVCDLTGVRWRRRWRRNYATAEVKFAEKATPEQRSCADETVISKM